jgi:CTP synthase (UTP-ammonia lyase)
VSAVRIALLGDYNPTGEAHQGAPSAPALAGESAGVAVEWEWLHTSTLQADPRPQLDAFQGL